MPTESPNGVLRQLRRVALLRDGGGMTDGQLLECFVTRQDEDAFAALVRRHGAMVMGVCRRVLRNTQDAEDAFQAAFLVLARKAASLRQRELLGNWLYGVAYRTALDARATTARRRLRERQVSEMPEPEATDAADVWRDLLPLLDQELNRLPDKYRVPVILCDLEGRTRREVARQLGIPEGTLSGRLTTARRMLAGRLAHHGLILAGGAWTAVLSPGVVSAWVPPPLVASTVKFAAIVGAGGTASTVLSARVAALTERMVKTMFVSQLKIATALILVVSIVAGAGMLAHQPTAAQPSVELAGRKAEKPPAGRDARVPKIFKLDGKGRKVAVSPDGKTLVVVVKYGRGSAVKLWDVETGTERKTLAESPDPGLAFQHVLFSADGKWIAATVSEAILGDVVKVWDAKTLALERKLDPKASQLVCVALSRDGKRVAAADPHDNTVKMWSIETGALERTLKIEGASPWSVAFSPDSKTLLVGGQKVVGSGEVTLWDAETGKKKRTLKLKNFVPMAAFSANRKRVAGMDAERKLVVWDIESDKRVVSLEGEVGRAAAFSPDGKTVAGGCRDHKVRLWDVQTGKLQKTLEGHISEIYSIAFSSDGKTLASVSQDQTVRLWSVGK